MCYDYDCVFPPGTIVAVLGHEENGGKFFVEDYCYSGLPYQAQPDLDLPLTKGEDRYILSETLGQCILGLRIVLMTFVLPVDTLHVKFPAG